MSTHRWRSRLSGREATIIVVIVAVAIVAAPRPSMGGLFDQVAIKDGTSPTLAVVTNGRLHVTDGNGPMTVDGEVAIRGSIRISRPVAVTLDEPIDVNVRQPVDVTLDEPIDVTLDEPVDVTGTVTAESPVDPSDFVHVAVEMPGDGDCDPVFTPPAGRDLVVTSVQIAPDLVPEFSSVPDPKPFRLVRLYLGTCSTEPFAATAMTDAEAIVLPFVPGVVVSPTDGLSASVVGGVEGGFIFVFGYLVAN